MGAATAFSESNTRGGSRLDRLAEALGRAPGWALSGFLAVHVALWGVLPALFQPNLPLDVIEQLAWGREWQWAYFKHPPLPAWILELAADLTHGSDRALFFVGPLASGIALWLIWRLAVDIVGPRVALPAVLVQEGVLYFTFFTPEFNHNVVQLPLWALLGWTTHRAVARGRISDWVATGAAAGLGMLGKYSTSLLLLTLALFIFVEPAARRRLRTPGPWLGLAIMLLVLAPHILALSGLAFGPLHFPFERAEAATHWFDHVLFPLKFAGAQLVDILPALLLLAALWVGGRSAVEAPPPIAPLDRRFVAVLCWGPFLLSLVISGVLGLMFKDMWGAPFWNYVGLFGLVFLPRRVPQPRGAFVALWAAILLLGPLAYAAQFPGQALLRSKPSRGQFPGRLLAQAIDEGWHRSQGDAPLRYVIGDVWLAGNVAFPLWRERPSVMIDGDPAKSPWIDRADLACEGAVLVWQGAAAGDALTARFAAAHREPDIDLPYRTWGSEPPAWFGWAIIPRDPGCSPKSAAG